MVVAPCACGGNILLNPLWFNTAIFLQRTGNFLYTNVLRPIGNGASYAVRGIMSLFSKPLPITNNTAAAFYRNVNPIKPSIILGNNLIASGITRPVNTAAHHIIMEGSRDPRMVALQNMMARLNIDINDAINGVFLPRFVAFANPPAITHTEIHTNVYKGALFLRFQSGNMSNRNDVIRILDRIKNEILTGTFPH